MLEHIAIVFLLILVVAQTWLLVRITRRNQELAQKASERPVGRVLSAEITGDGLMVTGEIYDDSVWAKMSQDVVGMSIGYSAQPPPPTYDYGVDHATIFDPEGDGYPIDLIYDYSKPSMSSEEAKKLFANPETMKLKSVSLDKEPNAFGYGIELQDTMEKHLDRHPGHEVASRDDEGAKWCLTCGWIVRKKS
jgi:hypothetical protein